MISTFQRRGTVDDVELAASLELLTRHLRIEIDVIALGRLEESLQ